MNPTVLLIGFIAIGTLGFGALLHPGIGIIAAGIAWLVSQDDETRRGKI